MPDDGLAANYGYHLYNMKILCIKQIQEYKLPVHSNLEANKGKVCLAHRIASYLITKIAPQSTHGVMVSTL